LTPELTPKLVTEPCAGDARRGSAVEVDYFDSAADLEQVGGPLADGVLKVALEDA
jgi:hypothetical protein